VARIQIGAGLQTKMDASDVVQQTILQAHEARGQFRGTTEAEKLAWLRVILANVLSAAARQYKTKAREIDRERSLEAVEAISSSRMEFLLAADLTSPSQHVVKNEELLRLAAALGQLPPDQRRVVELHHLMGLSMAEVAQEVTRTRPAVVGLLFRGLKRLRELMTGSREEKA
jgi:RNA polymerase sigma-70 factor (ECF subfamily)